MPKPRILSRWIHVLPALWIANSLLGSVGLIGSPERPGPMLWIGTRLYYLYYPVFIVFQKYFGFFFTHSDWWAISWAIIAGTAWSYVLSFVLLSAVRRARRVFPRDSYTPALN